MRAWPASSACPMQCVVMPTRTESEQDVVAAVAVRHVDGDQVVAVADLGRRECMGSDAVLECAIETRVVAAHVDDALLEAVPHRLVARLHARPPLDRRGGTEGAPDEVLLLLRIVQIEATAEGRRSSWPSDTVSPSTSFCTVGTDASAPFDRVEYLLDLLDQRAESRGPRRCPSACARLPHARSQPSLSPETRTRRLTRDAPTVQCRTRRTWRGCRKSPPRDENVQSAFGSEAGPRALLRASRHECAQACYSAGRATLPNCRAGPLAGMLPTALRSEARPKGLASSVLT